MKKVSGIDLHSNNSGVGHNGPLTISAYEKFEWLHDTLKKEGVNIPLRTGN